MSRSELVGYLGLSLSLADTEFLLSTDTPSCSPTSHSEDDVDMWIFLLPKRLKTMLQSAVKQEWPFLPPDIKPDWLTSPNEYLSTVSENLILLKCLLVTLEKKKYALASAVAFVLDRFMYWYGGAKVILRVVSMLERCTPVPPISPQMLIRRARVLKDSGDLHGAMRALKKITAFEWNSADTSSWQYKSKAQHDNVVAVCVQIEGQILHNLGLWPEAIHLLMKSIAGFESLPVRDEKGISSSLGILGKCLRQLSLSDYHQLKQRYCTFVQGHPCQEAYRTATSAAQLCPPQNLFTARHYLDAGDSLLRFAVQQENHSLRHNVLGTALSRFNESLAQHQTAKSLESREQCYEFLKALYLAGISLMFSPNVHDTRLAWVVEELSIALYSMYSQNAEGLGGMTEAVRICDMALDFLGLPGLSSSRELEALSKGVEGVALEDKRNTPTLQHKAEDGQTSGSLLMESFEGTGNSTEQAKMSESMKLAQAREVGIPADPHSSRFTNIAHEVFWRNAIEPSEPDLNTSNLSAKADPAAITLCSTYTIEALRDLQSDLDAFSSSTGSVSSTTNSLPSSSTDQPTGYTVYDEIELSSPSRYRPLVDWKGVNSSVCSSGQPEKSIPALVPDADKMLNIREVEKVVAENLMNSINKKGASRALLWQYDPLQKQWSPQSTLGYVGSAVPLPENKKGKHRDAINIQFLHQDESLGRYVGKRYRKKSPNLREYLQDVESQMTARYFVTLFNQRLQSLNAVQDYAKIQYLPAAHLQVLTPGGQIMDYLNVEPYLEGDSEFVKLTNNYDYSNLKVSREMLETALAFTHFTHNVSQGQTMIVDLQGWLPRDTSDIVYLTDPQFHSSGDGKATPFDQKERGMRVFWTKVHQKCNRLCKEMALWRPQL